MQLRLKEPVVRHKRIIANVLKIILFEFFHISSVREMVIVAFGFFILACLSESFKFSREYIRRSIARSSHQYNRVPEIEVEEKLESDNPEVEMKIHSIFSKEHSQLAV